VDEGRVRAAIPAAVEAARRKRHWSRAELGRQLEMSDDALAAWEAGQIRRLDLLKLVRLFEFAEQSMDEAFGISVQGGTAVSSEELEKQIERIANSIVDKRITQMFFPLMVDHDEPVNYIPEAELGDRRDVLSPERIRERLPASAQESLRRLLERGATNGSTTAKERS
jgi:transcriptional regulator with XRE-family HTH domain